MGRSDGNGYYISKRQSSSEDDFELPPTPPKQGSEYLTISDDRSAGSNLEARNLAALIDRAALKEEDNHASGLQKVKKRTMLKQPPKLDDGTSLRHARIQQRFGQLRLRPELRHGNQPGINDLNEEDGEQAATTDAAGKNSNRTNVAVEKSQWVDSGDEIEPKDRLWTDMETLQQKIKEMQTELRNLQKQKEQNPKKRYQILFRIGDDCYLDHPEWNQGKTDIVSHVPLRNFDLFLERNKSILFVVYRDFGDGTSKTEADKLSQPKHFAESVHLIDKRLREVFEGFLKQDWRYMHDSEHLIKTGEMAAPYLFIYHHRHCWKNILSQYSRNVRERLNLLATYVSKHYGHEYTTADVLFAQRMVSAAYVKYLFQPGDILISQANGQYRGLVASSWPKEAEPELEFENMNNTEFSQWRDVLGLTRSASDDSGSEKSIENRGFHGSASSITNFHSNENDKPRYISPWIRKAEKETEKPSAAQVAAHKFNFSVWNWSFDGDFKREETSFILRLSTRASGTSSRAKNWDIHNLNIYPLEYAPRSIQNQLRQRGRMFWDCRKRCQVSYHEKDTEANDQVSSSI